MLHKHYVLRSALIVTMLAGIVGKAMGSAELDLTEQTLQAVQDCMARSPAPWPDAWQREYVDTIRHAIALHQDTPQYAVRLEILRKGFQPYWQGLKKSQDRSLFEVHHAQIRWYTEHLMGTKLPCEDERRKLRNQYKELWNHVASSLLTQFPFLDPNSVHAAKSEHLSRHYRNIEAPLLPIYLQPFSDDQVEKIKERWDEMRYVRVDVWRQLGGKAIMSVDKRQVESPDAHPHYVLAQRSLAQLQLHIWPIVATPPDYYRSALSNRLKSLKRRFQSKRKASSDQMRLERSRLGYAEQISFLLAALLETPRCVDRSLSIKTQVDTLLEQRDRTAKGGDAYELKNVPVK